MASDTFEIEPAPRKRGPSGCFAGCMVAFLVMVLIVVLAGYWLSQNWRGLAGTVAAQAIEGMIDQSQLPEQQKVELKAQVRRVTDGFREGTISDEQLQRVVEGFLKSPLMSVLLVEAVEAKYFPSSGLSDEEKAAGRQALGRFSSGLMNEQIEQQAIDQVIAPIADRDTEGNWQLRDQVTDDQLRAFLDGAKAKADEAGVPEELEPIDPSDELKKIIDEALAGPAGE